MSNEVKSIRDVIINAGWAAEWEAEGAARGAERNTLKIAQNMVNLGFPPESIASATELDLEKVKSLYQQAGE